MQVVLAALVELYYQQNATALGLPNGAVIGMRLVEAVLLLQPLMHIGGPLVLHAVRWTIAQFAREVPEYPCPVCGYDIRETPHRCPECGTKLRWGQLP